MQNKSTTYSVVSTIIFIGLLLWWFFSNYIPPSGTYIGILAVMGVIMALLPPPSEKTWLKLMCIGIFTILFILETKSLYKARDDARSADERVIKHFETLISRLNVIQQNFSDLINEQKYIINNLNTSKKMQEETLKKVKEREGALVPDNLPNPTCRCSVPKNKETLYFAGGAATDMMFPFSVLRVRGKELIVLDKDSKGFYITAKIFDDRGDLIANIMKNKFTATYAASRIVSSKSNLIVYDHRDDMAFFVRFTNKHSIEIKGNFYSPDGIKIEVDENKLTFNTNTFSGNCFYGGRGFMEIN
jgi:hypothetical protein